MSAKPSTGRVRETNAFIKAHGQEYPVPLMRQVLGVAASGCYERLLKPILDRAREDARLLRLIRASFEASQGVYGDPRVLALALADVADDIESFYNPTRRHGHLGGVSPEQFESAHKARRRGIH